MGGLVRSWRELGRVLEGGALLLDLEPEEHEAVIAATMLLQYRELEPWGVSSRLEVPGSLSGMPVHPAGAIVAGSAVSDHPTNPRGPWSGEGLARPFGLPCSCEVFSSAVLGAIADGLLRGDVDVWRGRVSRGERYASVVHAGPRLLGAMDERRETWAQIW